MEITVVMDASVFIEHWRSRNKADSLLAKLTRQWQKLCVSAVAKYEVLAGADEKDMNEWNQLFENVTVLAFDDATIGTARMIYRQLKRENKLIGLGDIFIAATAIAHNLPLATLNRNHFERIRGLRLV
jgi:predicted nucleic acid-binding protein